MTGKGSKRRKNGSNFLKMRSLKERCKCSSKSLKTERTKSWLKKVEWSRRNVKGTLGEINSNLAVRTWPRNMDLQLVLLLFNRRVMHLECRRNRIGNNRCLSRLNSRNKILINMETKTKDTGNSKMSNRLSIESKRGLLQFLSL